MGNGRISVHNTLDPNVSFILILKEFEWTNRKKEEVFRCFHCHCYIFPDMEIRTKDGVKFHKSCKPKITVRKPSIDLGKKVIEKELINGTGETY